MARKRWTPQTEITENLIRFREKRKWQLGYRRYVLERAPSESYAPFFGLDIETLRAWFENQFTEDLNWDNFGKAWQFEHIVPSTYFDYTNEEDMKLCWSFINMRVEKLDPTNRICGNRIDLLAVKPYFRALYNKTGLGICLTMLEKIEAVAVSNGETHLNIEGFINDKKDLLEKIATLTHEEFNRLNKGNTVTELLLEREILRKFGSSPKP